MALKRNLSLDDTAKAVALKTLWQEANRGFQADVAKQLRISHQAVSRVWKGLSRSRRVEDALRRRGAPIGTNKTGVKKAA